MVEIPSPAVAVVGRHNSGKTTLVVKLIAELTARGFDVGSVKHHTHGNFEIDYPGKDSYRHREAGATETVIAAPQKLARVKTLEREAECNELVRSMPGHDIVIVEGYRRSGLPTIEVMRAENDADVAVAQAFAASVAAAEGAGEGGAGAGEGAGQGAPASAPTEAAPAASSVPHAADIREKMPDVALTVAIVTDIPAAREAASQAGIPVFDLNDTTTICNFLEQRFCRPRTTIVIQAGGESKRMGQSKALVEFCGRPLICRMVERLRDVADELIITTNEPDRLAFLHDAYPELGIRLVSDEYEFRGALPGLCTALNAASNDIVAIVACDMVFASPALVAAEALEMAEMEFDVVVPVNKHGFEPFHAAYRKSVCLPAARRALREGQTRVQSIFDDPQVRVCRYSREKVLEAEPRGGCFINTNTPEELAAIEKNMLED